MAQGLEQDRALPCAWIATKENHGAWNEAATEDAVEFLTATGKSYFVGQLYVVEERDRRMATGETTQLPGSGSDSTPQSDLAHGVPGLAAGTLSLPLGKIGSAVGTDITGFHFLSGHVFSPCDGFAASPVLGRQLPKTG
jgi:hypothetical protein